MKLGALINNQAIFNFGDHFSGDLSKIKMVLVLFKINKINLFVPHFLEQVDFYFSTMVTLFIKITMTLFKIKTFELFTFSWLHFSKSRFFFDFFRDNTFYFFDRLFTF